MKIHNNHSIAKAMKVYNTSNKNNNVEAGQKVQQAKDQLELSENAKEFQVAMKAFKNLPEVREEKIKELKEKIQQGSYTVSGKEVADKIIESLQIDKKI
ncbi:flagellar biosynthesis anti-sigma factor FlgM [Alkaliphilus transvaalensis]|uniref:flagellar biosynthesis anti-sigma factor FlgM n=1 Tax=Alkaliphilus transvaalensis TaxID=114628 RepID=UPI00047E0B2C|nr:flagellar biosynthesis anti-sigma factor FlgM [Alkaliphilus transvaalensis]